MQLVDKNVVVLTPEDVAQLCDEQKLVVGGMTLILHREGRVMKRKIGVIGHGNHALIPKKLGDVYRQVWIVPVDRKGTGGTG